MSQDTNQINVFRKTVVALVRGEASDLTARQLGVFLTCYLESNAQTVRGLAMPLKVSKPAISRSLDRLAGFDLIRRKPDPIDTNRHRILESHSRCLDRGNADAKYRYKTHRVSSPTSTSKRRKTHCLGKFFYLFAFFRF